ncbi:hypothetical protein [Candidatus Endomicrobiellum agilis]|uniref:hypothetical protein n=1 Tax=Candidatus Endomicrobiellum agilis TaxID=3238957 RepID=UPI003576CB02|nr:hypothetical protein [Endomicrobium sp.]
MIRTNGLSLAGFKAGEKTPDGKNEGVYKPQSEEVLRKKYNKNIKVLFQLSLLPVIAEKPITVTIKGKFSPEKKVGSILYFKNRTELKLCIRALSQIS